jgi:hypothetical protein
MAPIEFSDRRTWPPELRSLRAVLAERSDAGADWFGDDAAFFRAVDGYAVRLYHCTRLTPRESEDIRVDGMRLLSPELVAERLRNAVSDGWLTSEEGQFYGKSRCAREEGRRERIHFFANRRGLSNRSSVVHLLRIWGGEGLNMAWGTRSDESRRLWRIGTPTVVVADIDPTWASACHPGWLSAVTNGGVVGVVFRRPIPGSCIVQLHNPGSAFWERHLRWASSMQW